MSDENKKEDAYVNLSERFDQHKLNHIIEHADLFRNRMRVFNDDYDPFTIASKYLAKSRNGIIKTKYKQNSGFGRFYALGSLSLQSLPREIRHTIANEFYTDIDIKNAHPVILSFLNSPSHWGGSSIASAACFPPLTRDRTKVLDCSLSPNSARNLSLLLLYLFRYLHTIPLSAHKNERITGWHFLISMSV